ncbi:MAG: ABC transporter ATP-binding protein [Planctomycetota bacterium]|nr:ABC transporter ATP-binding protein [Planctomycetota bacterium]
MSDYLSAKDVSFGYDADHRILEGVNISLARGEFVAVIGPSGCGKSTLLKMFAGLLRQDRGSLSSMGRPISGPGLDRAVVFQDYSLFPWMSCRGNIVIALEQAGLGANRREREEIADSYLDLVGLRRDGHKLPGQLSGGMRQRTAIARALAVNAQILLMDEPFGALDEITRARQQDLLLELWQGGQAPIGSEKTGKTVFFVTHDMDEAILLGDRVAVMGSRPGRIVREVAIDLPRPRSRSAALRHENFSRLRDSLLVELNRVIDSQLASPEVTGDGGGI